MLDVSWETHATSLANSPDDAVQSALDEIACTIDVKACSGGGRVLVARDTRPHSARLAALALEGIAHMGDCKAVDYGLLTTPQLHHITRHLNGRSAAGPHVGPAVWASEAGYYEMLATAYEKLVPDGGRTAEETRPVLWVDCACGIGAPQLAALSNRIACFLPITLTNLVGEGALNASCGAEYVQKARRPPRGFETPSDRRACSLDGDADRVVYHYWRTGDGGDVAGAEWRLLDGDKIAALFATFLDEELRCLDLSQPLSMAVVQTAYANGASSQYIRSLGLETCLAKTGVKHVHGVAIEYDVSVYFEANGHGALLLSDKAVSVIKEAQEAEVAAATADAAKAAAANRILAARQLVNQAIGDALSDLLLVEAILCLKGWTVETWDDLYTDLPSRQTKLAVQDRTTLTVTADETRTICPAALQPELDDLARRFDHGRCFVRPSGTEDVVRVYAEAVSQQQADELALLVAQATWRLAGGAGEMPANVAE